MSSRGFVLCIAAVITMGVAPGANAADARTGGTIYTENCTLCHGDDGRGPKTPDYDGPSLVGDAFVKSKSDEQLLAFLKVGRQPDAPDSQMHVLMPAYGHLPEADLKLLVQYVRQFANSN